MIFVGIGILLMVLALLFRKPYKMISEHVSEVVSQEITEANLELSERAKELYDEIKDVQDMKMPSDLYKLMQNKRRSA